MIKKFLIFSLIFLIGGCSNVKYKSIIVEPNIYQVYGNKFDNIEGGILIFNFNYFYEKQKK